MGFPFVERDELLARLEQLRREGAAPHRIENCETELKELEGAFPVWEENRLSIEAFFTVRTQWIRDSGTPTGLDAARVESKIARFARLRGLDQEQVDRIHQDLDLMESVIVAEWAKQSAREARELERKMKKR